MKKTAKPLNSYIRLLLYTLLAILFFTPLTAGLFLGTDVIMSYCQSTISSLKQYSYIILWVFAVIEPTIIIISYRKVEQMMKQETENIELDIEDDVLDFRIVAWTTYTNLLAYLLFILSVMLFVIAFPPGSHNSLFIIQCMPPFLIVCMSLSLYSISYIKQAQRRDPTKKGDPSQLRFNKDWLESCDEAEKQITYQASHKTLTALNWVLPIFLIVAMFGYMIFQTGILSVVTVGGIWIIMNLVYLRSKLMLLKTKLNQ